VNSKFKK